MLYYYNKIVFIIFNADATANLFLLKQDIFMKSFDHLEKTDKIVCVGKNYIEHAKELGDKIPENPVIFLKPPSILKQAKNWGETLLLSWPNTKSELHYECEVVVKLNKNGYMMTLEEAKSAIGFVSLGLDMTLRTLQAKLKKDGHPWTSSKVFVDSAVVGPWIDIQSFPDYMATEFSLLMNNQLKQKAIPNIMTFKPAELLAYISNFFPLCEGDIIFTGTPAGVGTVHPGDTAMLSWGKYHYFAQWS